MNAQPTCGAIACVDWRELPLAGDGRCLVEASAGTGKTWTIAVLYLRLLLECEQGPRAIVVTTFSIAAAQELRERIRARLLEAAALVEHFDPGAPVRDDEGTRWLHARWSAKDTRARFGDRNRLALALAELDLAPIGTLHSLCRRILAEHPFDSGSAFDPGEQIDSADLDRELREDLWRRLAQSDADALDAGDRVWFDAGRSALDAALKVVCKAGVSVLDIDPHALMGYMELSRALQIRDWATQAELQPRKRKLRERLLQLADFLEARDPDAPPPTIASEKLGALLADQLKPEHLAAAKLNPVLRLVQRVINLIKYRDAPHKAGALVRYRQDLLAAREQRLHARGQVTYDALIERALTALSGPAGAMLAAQLREAWPVALVDEFQDTDAQQYAILDRIYSEGPGLARGRLVMIGDPKQAIYGFRGGDVQAYLDASASATHTLPITMNFRSSRELIGAINEVFHLAKPALSQSPSAPIAYASIDASGKPDETPFTVAGVPVSRPLAFHLYKAEKESARDDALKACANHIASMLDARDHRIGKKLMQPGDIAVLLPKNDDVNRLRVLLTQRRVPCVGAGKRSVFTTDIARDLQIALHGVEHASDETLVRAALATQLFGIGVEGVRALLDRPEAWQREHKRFVALRRQWRSDGVLAVIQLIISANATQFTSGAHSERTLTDLRHLGELLQQQSESCDGPESLLTWFAEQRNDDGEGDAAEDRQLRIESDAHRVQLMTLHASKGLQFRIVFLPLLNADATHKTKFPLMRAGDGARVLDLGSADFDATVTKAMFEEQDESFRRLYVALTRAQYACHVYASTPKNAVADDPHRAAFSALLARMRDGAQGRNIVDACAHIDWTEFDAWPWDYHAYSPDASNTTSERHALVMPATRPHEDRYSFSSLTPQHRAVFEDSAASDEASVEDAIEADIQIIDAVEDEPDHVELAVLGAYRGESFGTAMHAIYEERDPRKPVREQHALVRRCLTDEGFDLAPALIAAIAARVQSSLDAPLLPRKPSLRLSALDPSSMRAEMSFHYTLDDVSMQRLRYVCAQHGEPDLVPLHAPHTLRGLMTGAIDLIFEHEGRFHVLDYKSNYLGDRLGAYAPTSLRTQMARHHYRFQALLYTVALDRYLRQRLPDYRRDTQLGEAIYLFVRAVGLAPDAGVWSHRFDDALIGAVDEVLSGATAQATT